MHGSFDIREGGGVGFFFRKKILCSDFGHVLYSHKYRINIEVDTGHV